MYTQSSDEAKSDDQGIVTHSTHHEERGMGQTPPGSKSIPEEATTDRKSVV